MTRRRQALEAARGQDRRIAQYQIERELADRLREAPAALRPALYTKVYNELFERMPDHPQLTIEAGQRERSVGARWRFVSRFVNPGSCLMEIGAGDGVFTGYAARKVRRVIAVEVSQAISGTVPGNYELVISDGVNIPVEHASVDVAYSDQLMEHLHPDDAVAQLEQIAEALKPSGVYICITPNRSTGPHDISRWFDDSATGLHLFEYGARQMRDILRAAGFSRVDFYAGGHGYYLRIPTGVALWLEHLHDRLPRAVHLRTRDSQIVQGLLGLTVVATR
jgi:SAM-dependent methyltransferase